jgi:FKBP-type peptidyl-prolyl cis-trans isomerase (trigger factor)
MSDYSNYTERGAFNEALCNLVEEYLQEKDARPTDTVLAVNSKTKKIELGTKTEFTAGWETYPIEKLIRDNEDNSCKEVDIDATFDIASSFYFVR